MEIPDQITKSISLRAPLARVWHAVSDPTAFGSWFGVAFDAPTFVAGAPISGKVRPTTVDPEVAKLQAPHEGKPFHITVERVEPPRVFAFRWHPFAIDPNVDYSNEPTTLVLFELAEVAGETRLTITESGFSRIPLARRAEAFTANQGGWEHQARLIEKYVNERAS